MYLTDLLLPDVDEGHLRVDGGLADAPEQESEHLSLDAYYWLRGQAGEGRLPLHALALALVGTTAKGPDGQPVKLKRGPMGVRGGFVAVDTDQLNVLFRDADGRATPSIDELGGRVLEQLLPRSG